ncbi:unnamed protein product, partial [Ectocarpus sp. 12 AP-2014]
MVLHRNCHYSPLVSKESMQKFDANPCGYSDLNWVVAYLTELLNTNFDALVSQGSVSNGKKKRRRKRRRKKKARSPQQEKEEETDATTTVPMAPSTYTPNVHEVQADETPMVM